MTTPFYGFPKANTGVMPEAARFYKVVVVYRGITYDNSPSTRAVSLFWRTLRKDDDILSYIVTDIPIDD